MEKVGSEEFGLTKIFSSRLHLLLALRNADIYMYMYVYTHIHTQRRMFASLMFQ